MSDAIAKLKKIQIPIDIHRYWPCAFTKLSYRSLHGILREILKTDRIAPLTDLPHSPLNHSLHGTFIWNRSETTYGLARKHGKMEKHFFDAISNVFFIWIHQTVGIRILSISWTKNRHSKNQNVEYFMICTTMEV